MGFDEMLTPGRTCVGADDIHGRGAGGGNDLLPRPHLLLGEEDGVPPIICRDGIEEEDAGGSWMSHSGKRKRGESSPSGPEEGRRFRTEEKRAVAGEAAGAGSLSRPVCLRCGTSRTPMWRSGPAGPKTLCNACGIRYRKMRRSGGPSSSTAASSAGDDPQKQEAAAAAAAAAAAEEEEAREQGEKVRRRQRRRREVLWMLLRESRRFSFHCGEEEAEAAVLLMAISSGLFVHTSH